VRILVDVNVFIDVLTRRMNWAGSLQVLQLIRNIPHLEGWTSALTVPLLYFFRLRVFSEAQARVDAQTAVRGFRLVPLTQEVLAKAAASTLPDFEDNIQLASAESVAAEYLITRNTKDFQPSSLPVLTPEAWLALESVTTLKQDLVQSDIADDQE
jgi:hypothetical protein